MKYLIIIFILMIGCSSVLPPTAYKELDEVKYTQLAQDDWRLIVEHAIDLNEMLDSLNSYGVLSKLEENYPQASEFIKQMQDLIDSILVVEVK